MLGAGSTQVLLGISWDESNPSWWRRYQGISKNGCEENPNISIISILSPGPEVGVFGESVSSVVMGAKSKEELSECCLVSAARDPWKMAQKDCHLMSVFSAQCFCEMF